MLYFALTTLSTVGYGDYYPKSKIEMILTSVIMLSGVAFFSYIMSNFIEIVSNYDAKMGNLDCTDELNEWIVSLERFTEKGDCDISVRLIDHIISNSNYSWEHDRLAFLRSPDMNIMPEYIKTRLIYKYLFSDIFDNFTRFFKPPSNLNIRADEDFLSKIALGLKPRKFSVVNKNDNNDRIIYEEG